MPPSLLPDNTKLGLGALLINGLDVAEAASRFGTPLQVYDEAHLRARCREFVAAFPGGAAYATKAFLCRAMARLAYEEGMTLDVASGGEMTVALAAGVPSGSLILHGNNKSDDELADALRLRVRRIVVDSRDEMNRIRILVQRRGLPAPEVLIRVNPAVNVMTHPAVSTGQADSKFGFSIRSGEAAAAADDMIADPEFRFRGVHVHVGSQLASLDAIAAGASIAAGFARCVGAEELVIGGGLGVAQTRADRVPSVKAWSAAVNATVRATGFEGTISAEPGRSVVATAGITLYRVGTIKNVPSGRCYISIDGGLSDNPRPALYGTAYEAFLVRCPDPGADPVIADIVGKNCESGDTLASGVRLPRDVAVGDLLCMPVTGAYVHSMSSNYNKLGRAAVIFAAEGRARMVVRRESMRDLLATDVFDDATMPPSPGLLRSASPFATQPNN